MEGYRGKESIHSDVDCFQSCGFFSRKKLEARICHRTLFMYSIFALICECEVIVAFLVSLVRIRDNIRGRICVCREALHRT